MGDRWTIDIDCKWCGQKNEEVWFAPSCDVETFVCEFCKKKNRVIETFRSEREE